MNPLSYYVLPQMLYFLSVPFGPRDCKDIWVTFASCSRTESKAFTLDVRNSSFDANKVLLALLESVIAVSLLD